MDNPLENLARSKIITTADGQRILIGDQTQQEVPLEPVKPKWLDTWEPRASDVQFFRHMLRMMRDGSIWEVPATGAKYRIDKSKNLLILIEGKVDEWFWKNAKTLPKLGYTVIVDKAIEDGSGKTSTAKLHENNPTTP